MPEPLQRNAVPGTVASSAGTWDMVENVISATFGTQAYTLLSEHRSPLQPPYLENRVGGLPSRNMPRGRVFDSEREIRWRETEPGSYSIVFLSESGGPSAPVGFAPIEGEWIATETTEKLYGKWTDKLKDERSGKAGDWLEVAVPGINGRYEGIAGGRKKPLVFSGYDFSRNGITQITRYSCVKEFEEEK